MAKAYSTGYFTGKVLWLLITPQKLRNFFTFNDLQYTVYEHSNNEFILDTLIILGIPGLSQKMECFLQNLCNL